MKDFLIYLSSLLSVLVFFVYLLTFLFGFTDSRSFTHYCNKPPTKLGKITGASHVYDFGCYMGQREE